MAAPQVARLCGITIPDSDGQQNKELALSAASQNSKHLSHAVLAARSSLWENGTVLDYSFFGGSQMQRAKVEDVIQEWTWYANITFRRSNDNNARATLRIAFDPTKGSWSYVGSSAKSCAGPAPTINLGWIADTNSLTKKERGVILHEFGHVLGLMHEHESPARSGVLRLKEREIIQYYTETQGWDEDTVRKQVLDVYSKESVSNYSQFDPTSIMMYFMPGSMNEGGVDVHEVTELSMLDKAFIVANYPRSEPHPNAPQWTPAFALLAAGADSEAVQAYNATSDVDEKRDIFTRDMVDRRMREVKPSGFNTAVSATNVQTGSNASSKATDTIDDKFIQEIINQLNLSGSQTTANTTVNKPVGTQHAAQAEMVQNGILGMLLNIAPMILFAPNVPAPSPGSPYVAHAVLDPNNLSFEHPAVQHGLFNFFTKLASNETVKKVMAGAVKVAGGVVSDFVSNLLPQNALDTSVMDPQNGLLTDGFTVLVRRVVAHQVFQDAVKDIAGVPKTNGVQNFTYTSASYSGPQNALQVAHAEKVQQGIFSLLLDLAPKELLAPKVTAQGSSAVSYAVLDPHNLSLDHPVVQHGLMSFFSKLASNDIVKKVMAGAVKVAGNVVTDFVGNLVPKQNAVSTDYSTGNYTGNNQYTYDAQNTNNNYNGNTQSGGYNTQNANNNANSQYTYNTTTSEPQNGLSSDGLSTLVKKIVDHRLFKETLDLAASVGIQNGAHQTTDPTELAYKQRMNKILAEIWRRGGPTGAGRVADQLERTSQQLARA